MQRYYECGCCDAYHRLEYTGDCRNDAERFADVPDDAEVYSLADANAMLVSRMTTIGINTSQGFVDAKGRHGYFKVYRFDCWRQYGTVRIEAFAKRSGQVPPMVLETNNPAFMRALAQHLLTAADAVDAAQTSPSEGA